MLKRIRRNRFDRPAVRMVTDCPPKPSRFLKRVLIVDDELLILDLLEIELECLGFSVTIASNFFDAVYFLERENFDLLICDVMLSSCNGFDVLALARKKAPSMPAVMISGFPSDEITAKINEFSAYFLPKPLKIDELKRFVARIVPDAEPQIPLRAVR